jgi:protein TonB
VNGDLLEAGLPPVNDRLLTTCFLAALLHGIVILGVTFSSPKADSNDGGARALEVILVNDQAPALVNNPRAAYLAQRSQQGSGNTLAQEPTLIPNSSPVPLERSGVPGADGLVDRNAGQPAGNEEVVATRAASQPDRNYAAPAALAHNPELPLPLERKPDLGMTATDDGVELRLRGETMHQLWISADTRESEVAVYLDTWRRKVEHVGTINFPDAARGRSSSATPLVEATIGFDGSLVGAALRRSSGRPEIDEAAIRILRLAAPFDPFPQQLQAKHDEIRIAYEWQFLGGAGQVSGVFFPDTGKPPEPP